MAQIAWEDPPPTASNRTRHDWPEELRPLTEHPGKWARVGVWKTKSTPGSIAGKINKGKLPLVLGRWEARVGPVGDQWGLWVVYHGPNERPRSAADSVGARRAAAAEAL